MKKGGKMSVILFIFFSILVSVSPQPSSFPFLVSTNWTNWEVYIDILQIIPFRYTAIFFLRACHNHSHDCDHHHHIQLTVLIVQILYNKRLWWLYYDRMLGISNTECIKYKWESTTLLKNEIERKVKVIVDISVFISLAFQFYSIQLQIIIDTIWIMVAALDTFIKKVKLAWFKYWPKFFSM